MAELEDNPDNVDLNFKLAEKYQDRYERDKTIPLFEKVLELDPNNEKGHKTEATYQVALFKASSEQDVEPLKAFIDSDPGEDYLADAYSYLASTYSRMASMASRKGDPENTVATHNENMVATYEAALEALPNNSRLMYSYSSAIFRGKFEELYDKALELNENVKTLDPEMGVSTVYNLVTYYTNMEDKDKIVELFENAVGEYPDNARLKSRYASTINSMEIESKYDTGIEIMENALAEDPEAVYMNYTLGMLYHKNGDLEKAIAAVKKVVEKYPTRKVYTDALAKMEKELEETK